MQVGANVCTEGGNWNCKVVPEKHFSKKKTPYSSPKIESPPNCHHTVTGGSDYIS